MEKGIKGISTDSIRDIEEMKTWARDHELLADHKFDQMQAAISDLRDLSGEHSRLIIRNMKMLLIASVGFGAVLAVVVLLFGIKQIIGSF